MFVKQLLLFLPNHPSPLLSFVCRWWNCPSPYIIWNMRWWSRTCEELGIISSHPYITLSSLLCYDALMLQVQDQMMIDMFLRPLLLLLVFLIYCCFIGLLWFIDIFYFLYLLAYLKHTFLHLLEQERNNVVDTRQCSPMPRAWWAVNPWEVSTRGPAYSGTVR